MAGSRSDIEDNLVFANILHGDAGMFVYPCDNVRRLIVVRTPFVQSANQIRLGRCRHDESFRPLTAHCLLSGGHGFDKGFALEDTFGVFQQWCGGFAEFDVVMVETPQQWGQRHVNH